MYFVDREQIESRLQLMEKQITLLSTKTTWETPIEKAALERAVQLVIEIILDVGNSMIDGFIMRDPGSYNDIVDILTDEKVIPESSSSEIKHVISYRKMLVQQYEKVDHQEIISVLETYINSIKKFPEWIRTYLMNELGPVSAFKK